MYDAQIFICATSKDLQWLNCCLRSVQRFWKGAYTPIVVVSPECRNSLPNVVSELGAIVVWKSPKDHPYTQMTADCYMSAQVVIYMEPREMMTRSCDLSSFTDGASRPVLAFEPYSVSLVRPNYDSNAIQNQRWVIEELMGFLPSFEYTPRDTGVFHRHTVRHVRESVQSRNKRPLADLMRNYCAEYFDVFNFLGAYVYQHEREAYNCIPFEQCSQLPVRHFRGVTDPCRGEDFEAVQSILMQ